MGSPPISFIIESGLRWNTVCKYVFKRLGWSIVTVWLVITFTFVLMHVIPGNPFAKQGAMPPVVYENLMAHYQLDKPLPVQYGSYLLSLLKLDFGPSLKSSVLTVNDYIKQGFPVSLHLGLQALAIAITFGLITGVIAALYHKRYPDYFSMILAVIGISVPNFIVATILIQYVGVEWGLLPVATWKTWKHTIMPSFTLALLPMAYIARLMRTSMLEVLAQDYIKTARSKGLSKGIIVVRHAVRNAVLPVVTVLGTITANLITGTFIIEKIFAIPGMGGMFVNGIFNRDYPVILCTAVIYSTALIVLTFLVDLIYTIIDPRIKLQEEASDAR